MKMTAVTAKLPNILVVTRTDGITCKVRRGFTEYVLRMRTLTNADWNSPQVSSVDISADKQCHWCKKQEGLLGFALNNAPINGISHSPTPGK